MRIISRSSGYASALLLAGTAALAAPAAAQASAALPGPPVVPCSSSALVAAIQQANSARFATLVLSRGCDYVLTTAASGNDGLPPITGTLVVLGSGGTTISRSSSAAFRIFDVAARGRLTLANVTVANGNSGNEVGGGIFDEGTVVLRNVRLTGNTAPSGGGMVVRDGAHATVSFSELDGNNAAAAAGGAIDSSGDLVIDHSRVTGNTAHFFGGGVFTMSPGTSRITGTVVARNVAGGQGGGISNGSTMVLRGDRVVFNRAGSGGGIFNGGTLSLRLTLVAFNSPDNCSPQGTIRGCRH
jgi:hypothetical protein